MERLGFHFDSNFCDALRERRSSDETPRHDGIFLFFSFGFVPCAKDRDLDGIGGVPDPFFLGSRVSLSDEREVSGRGGGSIIQVKILVPVNSFCALDRRSSDLFSSEFDLGVVKVFVFLEESE